MNKQQGSTTERAQNNARRIFLDANYGVILYNYYSKANKNPIKAIKIILIIMIS